LGGAVTGGACVVKGHRQESRQCSAAAANCRAYRGNASGVVQTILDSSFEATSGDVREGWSAGTQSSEALTVGQHSLRVPVSGETFHPLTTTLFGLTSAECTERGGAFAAGVGGAPDTCLAPTVTRGHTYEIIMVGKGRGRLAATLTQSGGVITNAASYSVTLGPTWQLLRAGPIIVEQPPSSDVRLRLTVITGGGDAFLDAIILREVPQLTTVIKGSWQTPQTCDRTSIAQDAPPLALGMLGCRAYQPRSGPMETLRSFSRLCSESVVGCTAFHDTKNSISLGGESFNTGAPTIDDVAVPTDSIRYLVNDPAKSCAATAKGCTRFGKPTMDRSGTDAAGLVSGWGDAYLVDNPDRYTNAGAILCQDSQLFCDEYRGRDGALIYFKDPVNRTCQYKEEVTPITLRTLSSTQCATRGGTFVADSSGSTVGTCTISGVPTTGWFQGDTSIPCYENLIIEGARYGIRPNAAVDDPATPTSEAYQGWAGLCEAEQDQCSELRDPTDVSREFPTGRLYSVLHDNQLDLASCAGNVSRKSGCAILDESLNPSKLWSAAVTYVESDRQNGALVAPVDCDRNPSACRRCVVDRICRDANGAPQDGNGTTAGSPAVPCTADAQCLGGLGYRCSGGEVGPTCGTPRTDVANVTVDTQCDNEFNDRAVCRQLSNDTNLIAKVKRDRACSQWLEKDGCYDAWVPDEGRVVQACTGLRRTGIADAPGAPGSGIITLASYRSRPQTWSSADASGLSIPNQPPIGQLDQISTEDGYKLSLVHCPVGGSNCGDINGLCADDATELEACGPTLPEFGNAQGICVRGRCAYGLEPPAAGATGATRVASWPSPLCKVFPETDSPFPSSVVSSVTDGTRVAGFARANVCEDGECRCSYQKVQYGDSITKYFTSENTSLPEGYCAGGRRDGWGCNPAHNGVRNTVAAADATKTCGSASRCTCNMVAGSTVNTDPNRASENGTCVPRKRKQIFHGIEGYCLEEDRSMVKNGDQTQNACLSFLPIDQLQGSFDTNSQFQSAGLTLADNQEWYCAGKRTGAGRDPLVIQMFRPDATGLNLSVSNGVQIDLSGPDLFGPPGNMPAGFDSALDLPEEGHLAADGVVRDAEWDDNCEYSETEGWCGLPSSSKPAFPDCASDAGGCRYEATEDSNFYEGRYNFFGCYEVADDYSTEVFYPWANPTTQKIYLWQLAEMRVRFLHGDPNFFIAASYARCGQFTHEGSEMIGDKTVVFPMDVAYDVTTGGNTGWKVLRALAPRLGSSDGNIYLHAFFDEDDVFQGIGLETFDPTDEGSFFIGGLEFEYKSGCDRVAKVTDTTGIRSYSFTNRTGDWDPGGPAIGSNTRETLPVPWGGIVEDTSNALSSGRAFIPGAVAADGENQQYAGALYTWSSELRGLFAKAFEVRAVNDIDVVAGGTARCTSGGKVGAVCTVDADCQYPTPASSAVSCVSGTVSACRGGILPSVSGDGGACTIDGNCDGGRVCRTAGGAVCGGAAGCTCRRSAAGQSCTVAADCGTGGACEAMTCQCPAGATCPPAGSTAIANEDDGCRSTTPADCTGGTTCIATTASQCNPTSGVPPGIQCTVGTAETVCRNTEALCRQYAEVSSVTVPFTYVSSRSAETWDLRPSVGQSPVVFAVGSCDPSNGMCEEGGAGLNDTITVSGQSGGDVVGVGGLMSADMKFFYRADEDQLPIRRVRVEWGDGLAPYDPGMEATNSFPNRRGMEDNEEAGVSADSACNNTTFGTAKDVACIDRPFSMTHVYTCGGSGALPACTGAGGTRPGSGQEATGCYDASFISPAGLQGACVYVPRVHVKDNWGFCTGRCPNATSYIT
ncbi:hypothetical protein HY634_02590, partial [Candidatus Uhrbacteria bacterium]|nr:hypothetical protein [Candidatus Uhrbacteria bacterium]